MKEVLFPVDELKPGEMRPVRAFGLDLVVIRHPDGSVRALRDRCPHAGARLSYGRVQPLVRSERHGERTFSEDEFVLRCPWHNYEYDIDSGRCPASPKLMVRTYQASVEEGMVVLSR